MAGAGAGATTGFIFGGFLCLGLVLFAIASAVVLSLIPTFTQNHGQQGYGSVFTIDSFLLKFFYLNSTGAYYSNGTVVNSTDLSQRCTTYFQSLGVKNFAGCLVFNGRAWGPNNVSTTSRRRRRATTTAGMYYIGTATIYRTTSCPSVSDKNKTASSTPITNCILYALQQCNLLMNDMLSTFALWTSSNTVILDVLDASGYYDALNIPTIYGVPRSIAPAIASNLNGVTAGTLGELQRGCRYVGTLPISSINAILASQSSNSFVNTATSQPGG